MQMDVQAGVGYGIVVDGFAGNFGTFEITVSATKVVLASLTQHHLSLPSLCGLPFPPHHRKIRQGALGGAVIMWNGGSSCPVLPMFLGSRQA